MRSAKLLEVASVAFLLLVLLAVGPASALDPWSMVGTAAWVQGDDSDGDGWYIKETSAATPFTYASVNFDPSTCAQCLRFSDIVELSADFNGPYGGGSPRFSLGIDMDGDGTIDGNVFISFGPPPFSGSTAGWESTGNPGLIDPSSADPRYDLGQVGGSAYTNYAAALALIGSKCVLDFELVVDGGWAQQSGVQDCLVDNVRISGGSCGSNVLTKPPPEEPVGGTVYGASELTMLWPWLAVVGLFGCFGIVAVIAKKRKQTFSDTF